MPTPPLYTTGGTVQAGGGIYLSRQADAELFTLCQSGAFAYILTSRQMGKSSLMVQTATRLGQEGIRSATVDLSELGVQVTAEQWYLGFLAILEEQLGLETDVVQWWQARNHLGLTQRMTQFFKEVLLVEIAAPVVIFVDEIDSTLSLDFTDDFFAAIRYFYVARSQEPAFHRLSFVLIGVAAPSDLIRDKSRTPFNIGREIVLAGFQIGEVQPLMAGLVDQADDPPAVLSAVLAWTGGQPFLTQKLCQLILDADSPITAGNEVAAIEQLVRSRILENWETQDQPEHLRTIRDRLLTGGEQRSGRRLGLCQQIVQQADVTADDSPEQTELRLTGLVVKRQGKLHIYNRIYEQVFNGDWLGRSLANLRPYGGAIAAWLASGMTDDLQLLRGQELAKVRAWAQDKSLGDDDRRFLDASQAREMQTRLAAEQEANQILTAATKKANRRNLISLVGAAAALGVAAIAVPSALLAWKARDAAQGEETKAKQKTEQLVAEKTTLDASLKATQAKEKEAEAKAKAATQKYQQARQKEQAAQQQYQQAQQQVQQAQTQLAQVNQGKTQAEQATLAAQAQLQTAQTQVATAQVNLNQATLGLQQAKESQAIILQVNSLEKAGLAALNRAKFEQVRGLVDAMQAGEQARTLFQTKGQSGFAASPLYALQTILDRVENRAIQPWQHQTLLAHEDRVTAAQFSPDGKRIVTASYDNTARVWDAQSGQEIAKLAGHESGVTAAQFSPDGKRIVTASEDNTARVWDTQSGQEIAKLAGHESGVTAVQFSPDGKRIVTASYAKTARVWDAQSGQEIAKLAGNESSVFYAAQFSPDGKRIVTASGDNTARVWDAQSGQEIAKLAGHESSVTAAQFSPDGKRIVTASEDNTARVWDAQSGQEIAKLAGHESSVLAAQFSPDGKRIVTASWDKTARVWDAQSGQEIAKLAGHESSVNAAQFSPDGKRIVTASDDKTARVWDAQSGQEIAKLAGHESSVYAAQFSPDGKRIVTVLQDKTARVWDAQSGQEIAKLAGHEDFVFAAQFSPDGKRIVTASQDKTARVWDAQSGQEIAKLAGHKFSVTAAQFSPDGKRIVTASWDNTARVWDAQSGQEIAKLAGNESGVTAVQFSPDGKRIVTASEDNTARVWDTQSGQEIAKLAGHEDRVYAAQFSPDGKRIVTTSWDKTARVWDAQSGQEIVKLAGHEDRVYAAQFSPDGKRIVTASADNTARVWDAQSGQEIAKLVGHESSVYAAQFSPDGKRIVTASADKTVRVWPVENLDILLLRGCTWLHNYLIVTPKTLQTLTGCHTPALLRAAAPNLLANSEAQARSGNLDAAIQGFKTAQQWDPRLTFDPVARAQELAKAAKSSSHP
jgi:WD40 repeat protein